MRKSETPPCSTSQIKVKPFQSMNSVATAPDTGEIAISIEEPDLSRIVHWEDIRDTEMLDLYFKQRLGPGFRLVPVVAISRPDFISLINDPDGNDIYTRMCADDQDAANEAAFTYSPQTARVVNVTFHVESQNPGTKFLSYLNKHATTELHKLLLKHLLGTSKVCHSLHLQWKSGKVTYHQIAGKD